MELQDERQGGGRMSCVGAQSPSGQEDCQRDSEQHTNVLKNSDMGSADAKNKGHRWEVWRCGVQSRSRVEMSRRKCN